jgi:hypothetical protein
LPGSRLIPSQQRQRRVLVVTGVATLATCAGSGLVSTHWPWPTSEARNAGHAVPEGFSAGAADFGFGVATVGLATVYDGCDAADALELDGVPARRRRAGAATVLEELWLAARGDHSRRAFRRRAARQGMIGLG